MKCPGCSNDNNRVLETRIHKDSEIRRRRECLNCKTRFTTVETIMMNYPHVAKRDGVREPFSKEKLRRGVQLACLKRPVSLSEIESLVHKVSHQLLEKNRTEISSIDLGHYVMQELKTLDDVAYVRFASVYKTFKDVQEFVQTLKNEGPEAGSGSQQ